MPYWLYSCLLIKPEKFPEFLTLRIKYLFLTKFYGMIKKIKILAVNMESTCKIKVIYRILLKSFVLLVLLTSCNKEPGRISVFLAGDSTMADKKEKDYPETGWGQILPEFFNDYVTVYNYARNGRSSKSFIDEGLWDTILNHLQPGDYVFIQFGHNDQKFQDPRRYTNPFTAYRQNLVRFILDSKKKEAHPVLLTSIVRRNKF